MAVNLIVSTKEYLTVNILIAGGSGLIGQELIKGLAEEHHFTVLGRNKESLRQIFNQSISTVDWDELNSLDATMFDVVINLCGMNIAKSRWTAKVKEEIISSRVQTTERLVKWIVKQEARPHIYCANAVGIYGLQEENSTVDLIEETVIDFNHPKDFLSEICIRWQEPLKEAVEAGVPVTTTRFGVVLKKKKGFLGKLYPSFICGLGSVIGDGSQYLSWIDSVDLVNAYRFLLNHPELTGPVNITAPVPCMQKEFAQAYARFLHRPLLLKTPACVIRWLFGEMGESLINKGQRVVPKRLLEAGFQFEKPTIWDAFNLKKN